MKRFLVVFICVLVVCAAAAPVRGQTAHAEPLPTAAGGALTLERILPASYAFVGTVTDLDSDGRDIAYVDEYGTHVLTALDDGFSAETLEGTHLRAAVCGGLRATLDADGTVTVLTDEPKTLTYEGAVDIALTEARLVVLDGENVHFIPYAKTETSIDLSPAVSVAHGRTQPLALFCDGRNTAVMWQTADGHRSVAVADGPSESEFVFRDALYPFPTVLHGVAAIGGTVCYLVDNELCVVDEARTSHTLLTDNTRPLSEGRLTSSPDAICAYGDGVLIADSINGVGFIQAFDETFAFLGTLACSTDSDTAHLALPSAAAATADGLYIADTGNNRILTSGGDAIPLDNPLDIARGTQGTLRVLTPTAIVDIRDGRQAAALPFSGTDMLLRGDDSLLAAGTRNEKSGVWEIGDGTATLVAEGAYSRIASSDKRRDIAALSGDTVVRLTDGAAQTVATVEGACDLLCDDNGVLYVLRPDGLTAIAADGTATAYEFGGDWDANCSAYSLFLCSTDRIEGMACGDIGIVSRDGSAIYAVRGLAFADDWSSLVWPEDFLAETDAHGAFFRTTAATAIATAPDADFTFATIAAGTIVFAADGDTGSEFYRQIVVELPEAVTFRYGGKDHTQKLVSGFVLGTRLEALTPVAHSYRSVVRTLNVRLRKYPSDFAVALDEPAIGTTVEMLPMPLYRDPAGKLWLRVGLTAQDGTHREGYLWEGDVRREFYSDPISSGSPNATVHAGNLVGTVAVYAYDTIGKTYLPMMSDESTPITIPDGARVHIVGKFDSRAEFTEIVYTDAEFGELDCFVPTDRIERDDLGVIEAVAIVLFVMTVLIGVIVFVTRRRNRI